MRDSPRPAATPSVPDFDPVPVRARRDGWTPERQRAFIAELNACRCVLEACRRVGLSSESAYKLYRRADAASFRRAWDAAFAAGRQQGLGSPASVAALAIRQLPGSPAGVPAWSLLGMMAAIAPAHAIPKQASTSSASSTSAPTAGDADGMCQECRLHQLPDGHQLPPEPPAPAPRRPVPPPAYSFEAFVRAVRAHPPGRGRSAGRAPALGRRNFCSMEAETYETSGAGEPVAKRSERRS